MMRWLNGPVILQMDLSHLDISIFSKILWPSRFRTLVFAFLFLPISLCIVNPLATAAQANTTATSDKAAALPPKAFDWVDTSSPRDTLKSFLLGTRRYYELIDEEGYTQSNWRELSNIIEQAERLFDLRTVPSGHRRDVAHEVTALIREAIARVPLPDLSEIPDENEMAARILAGKSRVYRVPNTPFEIALTDSGPEKGRYQFTQKTVDEARDFYEEIKTYPYQPDQANIKGLYEAYFLSPGPLIPRGWVAALPGWLQLELFGNRVWQLLSVLLTIASYVVLLFLLHVFLRRVSNDWGVLSRALVLLLRPLTAIVAVYFLEWFIIQQIRLTGDLARVLEFIKHLLVLFASVVIIMGSGKVLGEIITGTRHFASRQLDRQLTRLIVRIVSFIAAAVIVIEEMHQLGFSFATLLAGASVGGLAIGLSAQDTLKNIFGGVELALDKPFEVGEDIKIKNYTGTVEEIGIRSTKIQTRSGHQVSIPNQDVAKLDIENIGRRPLIRRKFDIYIPYDTPPEKIRRAIELLKEVLSVPNSEDAKKTSEFDKQKPHPNEAINQKGRGPLVYFNEFNPDSLNLLVYYWYYPPKYWKYLEHATWINMQIKERFEAEGIDFAFPTQRLMLASDQKRPLDVSLGKQESNRSKPDSVSEP